MDGGISRTLPYYAKGCWRGTERRSDISAGNTTRWRIGAGMSEPSDVSERAKRLRERIAAKGLTLAEFARRAQLSRNVMYGLAKGREPRAAERARIDAILGPER